MNKRFIIFIFFVILLLSISRSAFAYIGPGLVLSTVVLTLGILAVLLLAIIAILYYPIKKMIKKAKLKKLRKK